MSEGASARAIALRAVRRVTEESAYSTAVIPTLLARSELDRRDRAFATELAFGTLRRLLRLDHAIASASSRPVSAITPGALAALRLGTYQLLFTDVPAHAAVGETVGLADGRERGFVNAVLRRVAAGPPPPPRGADPASISIRTGLAAWAVAELARLVGQEAEAAAAALAEPASLCLRVNPCRASTDQVVDALQAHGFDVRPAEVDDGCVLVRGADPARLPGFDEGWFAIQDQASAYVVRALDPRPGDRVWDVCAAPGGKATAIACAVGPGGSVLASDVRPSRAARIAQHAERLGVRPLILAQDGAKPAIGGSFDRVVVDAPCSGIGSARRRPELLWRVQKRRLSSLARLQVAIAASAAGYVRPGGRLVYAVCTFPRAETDAAVDALLRHRPELRPIETPGPDGRLARHRLWPHRHGSDGMFVAAFERAR